MSRKKGGGRGRILNGFESPAPFLDRAPSGRPTLTPVAPDVDLKVNASARSADAFKAVVERAADLVKNGVTFTGPIGPRAIFVYENEPGNPGASTVKTVSLYWKTDLQKEALIKRIKEKAFTEHASAVLVVTEAEPQRVNGRSRSSAQPQNMLILSGITPDVSLSARVNYVFDKETKSITLWEMHWLDRPVQNVFLDGVFERTASAEELQPGNE
jgi:hypothetical protein